MNNHDQVLEVRLVAEQPAMLRGGIVVVGMWDWRVAGKAAVFGFSKVSFAVGGVLIVL